jgi:hypothetical protein
MAFEYRIHTWPSADSATDAERTLTELGADGWEAVGIATRAAPVTRGGMGATVVPEIVTLLKRVVVAT